MQGSREGRSVSHITGPRRVVKFKINIVFCSLWNCVQLRLPSPSSSLSSFFCWIQPGRLTDGLLRIWLSTGHKKGQISASWALSYSSYAAQPQKCYINRWITFRNTFQEFVWLHGWAWKRLFRRMFLFFLCGLIFCWISIDQHNRKLGNGSTRVDWIIGALSFRGLNEFRGSTFFLLSEKMVNFRYKLRRKKTNVPLFGGTCRAHVVNHLGTTPITRR